MKIKTEKQINIEVVQNKY